MKKMMICVFSALLAFTFAGCTNTDSASDAAIDDSTEIVQDDENLAEDLLLAGTYRVDYLTLLEEDETVTTLEMSDSINVVLSMNEDGSGMLDVDGTSYTCTWEVSEEWLTKLIDNDDEIFGKSVHSYDHTYTGTFEGESYLFVLFTDGQDSKIELALLALQGDEVTVEGFHCLPND